MTGLWGLTLLFSTAPAARAEIPVLLRAELIAAGVSPRAVEVMAEELRRHDDDRPVFAIVDYTLASNLPRLFVADRRHLRVRVYRVAHGVRSGGQFATAFSNLSGSNESSLGFFKTGPAYFGKFGRAMRLEGLSRSNSHLAERGVVLHSAEYSSPEFLKKFGYWGRSMGCLAVPQSEIDELLDSLAPGVLMLAYHDRLWEAAKSHPDGQSIPDAPAAPAVTRWEGEENEMGDPRPHHAGDAPTSYYKDEYGTL